jgi:hypothetical protein
MKTLSAVLVISAFSIMASDVEIGWAGTGGICYPFGG